MKTLRSVVLTFVSIVLFSILGAAESNPSLTPSATPEDISFGKLVKSSPIIAALIGLGGAIIGGLFTLIVWPYVKNGLDWLWDQIKRQFSGRDFEYRYLDWIVSDHRYLPLLPTTLVPVNEASVQELDNLYVSLSLSQDSQNQEDISVGKALVDHPLLIILGDPGAGKTTMLRFLALTFGRARRKKPQLQRKPDYAERARIQKARTRVKEEFGFADYPLPVFVYLNRLRDLARWPKGRSLLDALRDEWKSVDRLRDFPEDFFEVKLRKGECIFLFDAFDELGSEDAREALADHIGKLASSAPQGNRFIVTSRIVGYSGQLGKYGFKAITVQRLSWVLIQQLATKWYDSLNASQLTDSLLLTLKSNPRIYELAVNPMLLSLIALVQYVKGLIPDRRHILYDECVKILVERRFAPPAVRREYDKTLPGEEATSLLQAIACDLHLAHLREVPRSELEDAYIPRAVRSMPATKASTVSSKEILKNIEARSQLLVERGLNEDGQPVMAFSHLTFQEYLTSVALKESIASRREDVVSAELLEHYEADPRWWEEVALLYAAQLDGLQRASFMSRLYPAGDTVDGKPE